MTRLLGQLKQKIKKHYNAISNASRLAIIITTCVLIFILWYTLLYKTLAGNDIKTDRESYAELTKETTDLSDKIQTLSKKINDAKETNIQHSIDDKQKAEFYHFITHTPLPSSVDTLVDQLLKQKGALKLVAFSNDRIPLTGSSSASNTYQLFKIVLTFEGNYRSAQSFLKTAQKFPEPLFWESLDYRVKKYPTAQMAFTLLAIVKPAKDSGGNNDVSS